MPITLSICVPTYNRLDKLRGLLEILQTINYPDIEILISDDSTNDETAEFFSTHTWPNIVYYRNLGNQGQFKNCNSCIARAKGEWIQILHDDDDIDTSYIEKTLPLLANPNLVLITGHSDIIELGKTHGIPEIHRQKIAAFQLDHQRPMNGHAFKATILQLGNPLIFSHTLFRRHTAIAVGCFDANLKFIGDLDLWLKLLNVGDIAFINHKFGNYYLHNNNQLASSDSFVQQWLELVVLKLEMLSFAETVFELTPLSQYKAYLQNNLPKARFYMAMIRHKNPYAGTLHHKINALLKHGNNGLAVKFSAKILFFNTVYWLAIGFPESLFSIYTHFLKLRSKT